jgi:hypothetical protein
MSILTVIPFHQGDLALVKSQIAWINELHEGEPRYSLLLAADSAVPSSEIKAIADEARKSFAFVTGFQIMVPPNNQGWIKGSDFMFLRVARWVKENTKCAFLWMEPDAVPLKSGWLDDIQSEYSKTPYKYMGAIVRQNDQPLMPKAHLNGNAVYPNEAYEVFNAMNSVTMGTQAFDIAGASVCVPATKESPLFQSFWGTQELAPIFVKERTPESPKNHIVWDKFIRPDAVFFHRDKTHSLIPLLREKMAATVKDSLIVENPALELPAGMPEQIQNIVKDLAAIPAPEFVPIPKRKYTRKAVTA